MCQVFCRVMFFFAWGNTLLLSLNLSHPPLILDLYFVPFLIGTSRFSLIFFTQSVFHISYVPLFPVTLERKIKVYGIFLYTLVYCVSVENLETLISNCGLLEARSLRTKWTLKIWLVVSIILLMSALIKVVTRGSLLKASILAKPTPMLSAKGLH